MKLLSAVAKWSSASSYLIGVIGTDTPLVVNQYQDSPGFCVSSRTPPCPKNHGLSTITVSFPGSVVIEWQPAISTATARSHISLTKFSSPLTILTRYSEGISAWGQKELLINLATSTRHR